MAITKRGESRLALQLELISSERGSERRQEIWWLLGASVLVATGLVLVLIAKTQDFASVPNREASGELLNLNAPHRPSDFSALLSYAFSDPRERELAAEQLTSFLDARRPLPNVGALARLRVTKAELEEERFAAWRRNLPVSGKMPASVPLLPLSKLKPFLVVRRPGEFLQSCTCWVLLYLAAFWIVHLVWRWRNFRGDPAMLPAVHLLTGMGLILMISLRDPLRDTLEFRKFAWGAIAGCAILLLPLFKAFQYRNLARFTYTPLLLALALFGALLRLGSGPTGSDARVNLGPFQPVEVIKILLVFFLAGYFAGRWEWLRELRQKSLVPRWLRWLELPRAYHALPVMSAVACALVLFFALKDMGPALVTGMLFLIVFAIARRRSGLAVLGLALLVGGVFAGCHFGTPHTVVERVSMWLSPWNNDVRGGDQLAHSLWAFATGGPWGSGPGWGDPAVIPAGHTDLVLPSIAEEWGFPGVVSICLLLGLLVKRAFRIALHGPDEYALFLAAGCGTLLALEMLLISGGALGAIPLSGVVSPFLSSGNTAMLSNFLIVAVLLGISSQSARLEMRLTEGKTKPRFEPLFGRPMHAVSIVLGLCALALLLRAAYLEIWHDRELLAKDALVYANDGVKRPQRNPRLNLLAAMIPRGNIYDRNGILLATSSWRELERHRPERERLGVSADGNTSHVESRYYPFGPATVQLLGDLRTGERFHASNASLIEHDSNSKLQGFKDYQELAAVVRYRHQQDNPALQALLNRDRDVHTSVDIRLQLKLMGLAGADTSRRGAAVVMNAQTGDLLALVSWPPPNSNNAGGVESDEFLDRARYGEYPPGSTFKLVTAMAALRVDPQAMRRTFSCRRLSDGRAGTVIAGWRRPIRDDVGDRVHGTLNMSQAITVSCNAYFAQLGVFAVGSKALRETAGLLGIDAGTEAEVKQMLPFASYGQGTVVTTPLKMARVAAAIAADGAMPQGRWVLDGSDGRNAPSASVISPAAATFLAGAMRSVVTSGTARTAMTGLVVPVAGKTGTAQLDRGQPHSWFAGFAPYDGTIAQRIAFAVVVEHGGYGAKVAAPMAREIVEAAAQLGMIVSSEGK
ncbi:MAG: FtsW/RodA/SpoVE family cell cycle protein [Acidobacteriaceae bacterium]|nr:FtsW/RodA/SpoVE family cell cycle protein [Acidobacteriaceae bacterium]